MPKKKASLSFTAWTHLASNIHARDKIIKVLQYGSRMLLAFYGSILPNSVVCTLSNMKNVALLARKSFRLFKSVNHVTNIAKLIKEQESTDEGFVFHIIKVFEQLCWALFFFYDNKDFLSLTTVVKSSSPKDKIFFHCAWVGADSFYLLGNLGEYLTYYCKQKKLMGSLSKVLETKQIVDDNVSRSEEANSVCNNCENNIKMDEYGTLECEVNELKEHLLIVQTKLADLRWHIIKGLLHLSVSSNTYPFCFWKKLLGERLSDGPIGLLGILSSLMIIFENWPQAIEG